MNILKDIDKTIRQYFIDIKTYVLNLFFWENIDTFYKEGFLLDSIEKKNRDYFVEI